MLLIVFVKIFNSIFNMFPSSRLYPIIRCCCLNKNLNVTLFLKFSALVSTPKMKKKKNYTVANPARGLLNRGLI